MDCLDREDKNMNRRVVVTGLGAITPIGNNVPEFWSAVKQQKVGVLMLFLKVIYLLNKLDELREIVILFSFKKERLNPIA